jgi:hypothetical protein
MSVDPDLFLRSSICACQGATYADGPASAIFRGEFGGDRACEKLIYVSQSARVEGASVCQT